MASLPLASSMAHLDICLVYYVNKSRLACYNPPGCCFCCVAEMCGAQLGCLPGRVNPLRQISWGFFCFVIVFTNQMGCCSECVRLYARVNVYRGRSKQGSKDQS